MRKARSKAGEKGRSGEKRRRKGKEERRKGEDIFDHDKQRFSK
jgi:hypothetical protein